MTHHTSKGSELKSTNNSLNQKITLAFEFILKTDTRNNKRTLVKLYFNLFYEPFITPSL